MHENDTRIPEIGSLGPKTIAEAEGSGSEPALGSLNLTTRQADSDIPFKERLSDASALKEVVTMASGLPKDATEGSGNCPTKKEEGTVVDWDPVIIFPITFSLNFCQRAVRSHLASILSVLLTFSFDFTVYIPVVFVA